jgi:hypothetical protein
MRAGPLTTTFTAVLAGPASQADVAEPAPAPPALTAGPMLAQWQGSCWRAGVMQASLARIDAALGCLAAYRLAVRRWLRAALLLLANRPFTLVCIKPTNDALNQLSFCEIGPAARHVATRRWLHAGRNAVGATVELAN